MTNKKDKGNLNRRRFFKLASAGSLGAALIPLFGSNALAFSKKGNDKPKTNVRVSFAVPRNKNSMPGLYPAKVVQCYHKNAVVDNTPVESAAYEMLEKGILALTGESSIEKAWRKFVSVDDVIGLKLNPVAGKPLSTSHAVVKSVIAQLEKAGISRKNIVLFDRREYQLHEIGFTQENYPGVRIEGYERKDSEGSFFDKEGKQYAEKLIDKTWYYWADVEGEYDERSIHTQVNGGRFSYFSRHFTETFDKVINIPIMKNAGASVTLGLKNLGYGVITNTSRLHAGLWSDTCAEVCAFAPVRDKVVLTIIDGLKGCYNGGPGANPQFICNYNTMVLGTDPVAVDRVGYEEIFKKRIEEKLASRDKESPRGREFLEMAAKLKLGEANIDRIDLKKIRI